MNTELDDAVREILREIADEARPASLAALALRRAGRIRRRRTTIAVVAAGVAMVALAAPYAILRDRTAGALPLPTTSAPVATTQPPRATPSVDQGPVELPGGWLLAGGPGTGGTWIWDRVHEVYRLVPYQHARPAPVGDLVAVESATGLGVLNLRSNQVRWLTRDRSTIGGAEWTTDGRRLVYGLTGRRPGLEIFIADAAQGLPRKLAVIECVAECGVHWLPNEQEVAMAAPLAGDELLVLSAVDGQRTKSLPWHAGARQAWSPDGRFVVAQHPVTAVVEISTGLVRARLPVPDFRTVYWTDDGRILAIEAGGVGVYSTDGHRLDFFPRPAEFTDDELLDFTLSRA